MKNDAALLAGLNEAIRSVFRVEGDVDNLAFDAGLIDDWVNFKSTSSMLELALNRLIQRAEANRVLVNLIDVALERSRGAADLQVIADQYVRPAREPLESLGVKLEDLEKLLFGDIGLAAVATWAGRLVAMSRAVCLIRPEPGSIRSLGTGFLVGPDLMLTTWAVAAPFWGKDDPAARVAVEFSGDADDAPTPALCRLMPAWQTLASNPADAGGFALLKLDRRAAEDLVGGKARDYLKLSERGDRELAGSLAKGDPLLFLRRGPAEPPRLMLGQSPRVEGDRFFRYTAVAGAAEGSAGAPCFSQALEVIGLNGDGANPPNRGVLASAIEPLIRDAVRRTNMSSSATAISPLQAAAASPAKKRALFLQPAAPAKGLAKARAESVLADLIRPAFEGTDYEPVPHNGTAGRDELEPLVSPLSTEPLVVADLGSPPWDPRIMMEVGFRIANAKPLILLADAPAAGAAYPKMLDELDVIRIDTNDIAASLEDLRARIAEYRPGTGDFWSSQYPYVDFQMPLDDPSQAVYIHANDAAARLYGLDRADDLIGKRVEEYDDRLYQFMPEAQRSEFVDEQILLLGTILWPQRTVAAKNKAVNASVRIPLWLANHAKPEFQGRIYLPLLVQHKVQASRGLVLMRSVFVDISSWAAPGLSGRPTSTVLSLPEIFRRVRDYQFDVFLPCDSADADYARHIRDLLADDFNCTVWFKGGGAEDPSLPVDELVRGLYGSRMAGIPIGKAGMGEWEERMGVRQALQSYLRAGYPHIFLILPDVENPDGWKRLLPDGYADLVRESLFLPLQKFEDTLGPVPISIFVERIVRELFKVFRQQ